MEIMASWRLGLRLSEIASLAIDSQRVRISRLEDMDWLLIVKDRQVHVKVTLYCSWYFFVTNAMNLGWFIFWGVRRNCELHSISMIKLWMVLFFNYVKSVEYCILLICEICCMSINSYSFICLAVLMLRDHVLRSWLRKLAPGTLIFL